MRMIVVIKSKKYKVLDKYSAVVESPYSFIAHLTKKFKKDYTASDGLVYQIPRFSFDELKDAYHRGSIKLLYVI
jgi:hypothetical protein